jgi:alkylation response protein AidB-like acyl-CoA dehydrogenase
VLPQFGTEAQTRTSLTAIARGDLRWCQGYSEPGAGSDLASLACRAERDGDTFVLNGSKIWTSHADLSDWMFCLVRTRTGPRKQEGITFILIDLRSPGVQIRPILLISGASPFCEVFFEDVRVPAEQVVHEVDAGWTVAKALLQHERTAIGVAIGGQLSQAEGELVSLARRALDTPEGPLPGAVAQDLARFGMEAACFDLTRTRLLGGPAGPESSTLKLAGTELKQRRLQLAMQLAGPDALGWSPEGFEPDTVQVAREWLRSRGNSIEGGTSEIQLNIIARRVLGLPEGA